MLNSFIVAEDPSGAVDAVEDVNDNSEDRSSTLSASVLGDIISYKMIKIWRNHTILTRSRNSEETEGSDAQKRVPFE